MKVNFGKFLVAAFALSAVSAFGIYRPGWERPIWKAQMVEKDQLGHEIGIGLEKELTLNQQDGAGRPTSMTLTEEQRVYCITAPCPPVRRTVQFRIVNSRRDGCGTVYYTGIAGRPDGLAETLTLADHSTRVCMDYRPYRWEAQLSTGRRGVRLLYGNPESVITIQ